MTDIVAHNQEILSQLHVTELTLPAGSHNPYHQLRGELGDRVPEVLFVYGLETLHDPEGVLKAFNSARDLFAQDFPFPMVFWLTQDISTLQSRIAKDWDSWGRTLSFAVDVAERRERSNDRPIHQLNLSNFYQTIDILTLVLNW